MSEKKPSSSEYLDDGKPPSSESEKDCSPPPNFRGRLVEGEKWIRCVYFKDHKFLSTKTNSHLSNCRHEYELEKSAKHEPMDIGICRYTSSHHVKVWKLERHEMMCDAQLTLYGYLEHFIERQKRSKIALMKMPKEEDGKKGDRKEGDGYDGDLDTGKDETQKYPEKMERGRPRGRGRGRGRGNQN